MAAVLDVRDHHHGAGASFSRGLCIRGSVGCMPCASSAGSSGGYDLPKAVVMLQGLYKFHQYQVVGRHLPTPNDETPQIYRMKLWATDAVRAK